MTPAITNYHCCTEKCGYKTTADSAEAADRQLVADGGTDAAKTTKCPKCNNDSLVFLT